MSLRIHEIQGKLKEKNSPSPLPTKFLILRLKKEILYTSSQIITERLLEYFPCTM